jgi:hypothetical protein
MITKCIFPLLIHGLILVKKMQILGQFSIIEWELTGGKTIDYKWHRKLLA